MKLVLIVHSEAGTARKVWISPGQSLTVGSSDRADLALSSTTLQPLHFQVSCDFQQATVQLLDAGGPLELNNQPCGDAGPANRQPLGDGDRLRAAGIEFEVELIGQRRPFPAAPTEPAAPAVAAPSPGAETGLKVAPPASRGVASPEPAAASGLAATRETEQTRLHVIGWGPAETSPQTIRRALFDQSAKAGWTVGVLIDPGAPLQSIAVEGEPLFIGTHLSGEDRERLSPRLVLTEPSCHDDLIELDQLPGSLWFASASGEEMQQCLVLAGQGRWSDQGCPRPEWMLKTAEIGEFGTLIQTAPDDYLDQLASTFAAVYWEEVPAESARLLLRRGIPIAGFG